MAICNTPKVSPEYLLCNSLVASACAAPANVTGQDMAQLRKTLCDALEIVDKQSGE